MSIITNGEAGGSLTSGNTSTNTNNGREDHHHDHGVIVEKQEFIPDQHQNFHIDSVNSLSSTTTLSNGSTTQLPLPIKKKRNPPGNPDPSAEVVALSPNTLVTKNRFVCEICSKGFQRDQNLQLHRRGHNLPWKLRQRNANEVVRKRVYVCPEASCVHHNPARALGDLTGIKKHFSRKHGDKKWKCDRCSKKYAVHSDWKAHSKTCGTREYKCECGTIFSRRDSFITHRAFCDAIAEENSKTTMLGQMSSVERHPNLATQISNRAELISSLMNNNNNNNIPPLPPTNDNIIINDKCYTTSPRDHHHQTPQDLITSTTTTAQNPLMINNNLKNPLAAPDHHHHDHERGSTIITTHNGQQCQNGTTIGTCHYMSATALLQKAAQMGSTASAGAGSGGVNNGSVMAPPSYGLAHHDQYGHHGLMMINVNNKNINGNSGSNDNNNNNNNNVGFFGGLLFGHHHHHHGHAGQNDVVLHGGNSATTGGDVMTVDFLGIGRSQKQVVNNNLQGSNNQQSKGFDDDDDQVLMFDGHDESDNLQGLSHFEQHAEIIGKQFWEV